MDKRADELPVLLVAIGRTAVVLNAFWLCDWFFDDVTSLWPRESPLLLKHNWSVICLLARTVLIVYINRRTRDFCFGTTTQKKRVAYRARQSRVVGADWKQPKSVVIYIYIDGVYPFILILRFFSTRFPHGLDTPLRSLALTSREPNAPNIPVSVQRF